ncbi:MAG: DNA alkylation repair protein [Candidatus Omnitrophota bacterium]|nr:DNA alkylation repair protein [Candidatus Omnitrophota bacterium]MBU2529297.1 DNA alkylation repair protein [bacterium]MBU3930559.1 DNA alkylation repair protein [bacterium]MBU4123412.1 DNA alkylation repair protein [bacterium]
MSNKTDQIIRKLKELGDKDIARHSQRFFKTGKGEYGEGDIFLGLRVPAIRECVKTFKETSLDDTLHILKSPFHEARLLAVLMLVDKYSMVKTNNEKEEIYRAYLSNREFINNWDLVDSSAHYIVGQHLFLKDRKQLYKLLRSASLWDRRIGIMSTFYFIKKDVFDDTLAIAKLLLEDTEDLIHKAVGWMLREVGNRDRTAEEKFLKKYYKVMPRTMLRYAIEKFPEKDRQAYLKGIK